MFKLKFHVPISGLLVQFVCQNLGYIFQITSSEGCQKNYAAGWRQVIGAPLMNT